MATLFGFEIKRAAEKEEDKPLSFAAPVNDDGAVNVEATATGGSYGYYLDIEGTAKNESELITRYRGMSLQPEIQQAVEEVTNEAINIDHHGEVVELNLDGVELPDKVKDMIIEEFGNVLRLLDFSKQGYDVFQRFFVDGRINYHIIIDEGDLKKGILELRYLDPRKIRPIRETDSSKVDKQTGLPLKKTQKEYYMYSDRGFGSSAGEASTGYRISKDSIARVTSGLMNENQSLVLSHLHRAIKPLNELRTLEDAHIIYTLTRAPERRIFYVDVGNLPKAKAEQYLTDMMARHKNKLQYDSATGEMSDSRKFMTMTEDFWFPRREGCFDLSTKIDLLDGRSVELGQLIVEYKAGKTNWAYSVGPNGEIVPGKISWAGVTRNDAQVLDVYLDNGEIITATPDHKFILRTGEIIQAQNMQPGTSLMPFSMLEDDILNGAPKEVQEDCVIDDEFIAESKKEWEELAFQRGIQRNYNESNKSGNHCVDKIVWREDTMDVGTLTIDEHHEHHDYHNFALSAGIFVMNSRSTEVDSLPGGATLGDNDNLQYFQKKLYKALSVPISRLESENAFQFGRVSEMTRDEIRFGKFVRRLRSRFSMLFDLALEKQLVLKGILTPEEWADIKNSIRYNFKKDNYFEEMKQMEVIREKMNTLRDVEEHVGVYYSRAWVRRNILFMTDEDKEEIDKEIDDEKETEGDDGNDDLFASNDEVTPSSSNTEILIDNDINK